MTKQKKEDYPHELSSLHTIKTNQIYYLTL